MANEKVTAEKALKAIERIKTPSSTDEKALIGGVESLLTDIETMFAISVGNLFFDNKANTKKLSDIQSKAGQQSPLFKAVIDINKATQAQNTILVTIQDIFKSQLHNTDNINKTLLDIAKHKENNVASNVVSKQEQIAKPVAVEKTQTSVDGVLNIQGLQNQLNKAELYANILPKINTSEIQNILNTVKPEVEIQNKMQDISVPDSFNTTVTGTMNIADLQKQLDTAKFNANIDASTDLSDIQKQISGLSTQVNLDTKMQDITVPDNFNTTVTGTMNVADLQKQLDAAQLSASVKAIADISDMSKTINNFKPEINVASKFDAQPKYEDQEISVTSKIDTVDIQNQLDAAKYCIKVETQTVKPELSKVESPKIEMQAIKPELDLSELKKTASSKDIDNIATNIKEGVLKELDNTGDKPESEITNFQEGLTEQLRNAFQIHSPSKLMAQAIGAFIKEGILEGIKLDKNDKTAEEFKKALIKSFKESDIAISIQDALESLDPFMIYIGDATLDENFSTNAQNALKTVKNLSIFVTTIKGIQEAITNGPVYTIDNVILKSVTTSDEFNKNLEDLFYEISSGHPLEILGELDKEFLLNDIKQKLTEIKNSKETTSIPVSIDLGDSIDKLKQSLKDAVSEVNVSDMFNNIPKTIDTEINVKFSGDTNKELLDKLFNSKSQTVTINAEAGDFLKHAEALSKIDVKTLDQIGKQFTDKDKGTIATAISNISKGISDIKITNIDNNKIKDISQIINIVAQLGQLDVKHISRVKKSLNKVADLFDVNNAKSPLIKLISNINTFSGDDKTQIKDKTIFEEIHNIIYICSSISELSELEKIKTSKIVSNINKIADLFDGKNSPINNLIKSIQEFSQDGSSFSKITDSVSTKFEDILDMLGKLNVFYDFDIDKAKSGIYNIKEFIRTDFVDFINNISDTFMIIKKRENISNKIFNIIDNVINLANDTIDNINDIRILTIIKSVFTLMAIENMVDTAKDLIKTTASIDVNITKNVTDNFTDSIDNLAKILNKIDNSSFGKYTFSNILIALTKSYPVFTLINKLKVANLNNNLTSLNAAYQRLNDLVNTLNRNGDLRINAKINTKSILTFIKTVKKVNDELANTKQQKIDISSLQNVLSQLTNKEFKKQLESLSDVKNIITSVSNIEKIANQLSKTVKVLALSAAMYKAALFGLTQLNTVVTQLKTIIGNINNIPDLNKGITNIHKLMGVIGIGAAIMLIGGFIMSKANIIMSSLLFVGYLSLFMYSMTGVMKLMTIVMKNSTTDFKNLLVFQAIVALSAAVLIMGGLVMNYIEPSNLLLFGLTLGTFILAISGAYAIASFASKASIDAIQFGYLVAISGATLILGSLVMRLIRPADLILFTVTLAGFMLALSLPYIAMSKWGTGVILSAVDFGKLVMMAGLTMILGGLFMRMIKFKDLALFTATLAGFMLALSFPYILMSKFGSETIKGAAEFGKLVMMAGLTMILGSLFMKIIKFEDLALFTATLAAFIIGIGFAYKIASAGKNTMEHAGQFAKIIIASALILMIGAIFARNKKNLWDALLFGAVFTAFIIGIGFAMKLASDALQHGKGSILALTLFVIVITAVMAYGANYIQKYGWEDTVTYIVLEVAFIGAMALICYALSKKGKDIAYGILAMLGIAIIIGLSAIAFKYLAKSLSLLTWDGVIQYILIMGGMFGAVYLLGKIANDDEAALGLLKGEGLMLGIAVIIGASGYAMGILADALLKMNGVEWSSIGKFAAIIGGTGLIAAAIGFLCNPANPIGAAIDIALAIGEGVMLSLAILILAASKAVKAAVETCLLVQNSNIDYESVGTNMKSIFSAIVSGLPDAGQIISLDAAAVTMMPAVIGMSKMISKLASAVKDFAELKIPIYDEAGKLTGYRSLTNDDFTNAATNIHTIITTVGGAILKVYADAPAGMFDADGLLGNLGIAKTPFQKVVRSCTDLGHMIAKIAEGVKDYAELKIPIYKGTSVTGYRNLTSEDFTTAAINIQTIITTLGQAIIDTYNSAPEGMFEAGMLGFGDTPFDKVVKSCTGLGKMISKIADGVKDYADLKVPIYSGTKVVSYRHLKDKDFSHAATNIRKIISYLGGAILGVYNDPRAKGMFENTGIFGQGDTPFDKVVKSCMGMTRLITGIASSVQMYSYMRFPDAGSWDPKTGKYTSFHSANDEDFNKAGKNISTVLTLLGDAIKSTYDENNTLFDPETFKPITNGLLVAAKAGSTAVDIVSKVANLSYVTKWDPSTGKPLEWAKVNQEDIEAEGKIYKMFNSILLMLPKAMIDTIDSEEGKKYFGDNFSESYKKINSVNQTFIIVNTTVSNIVKAYTDLLNNIKPLGNIDDLIADLIADGTDKSGNPKGLIGKLRLAVNSMIAGVAEIADIMSGNASYTNSDGTAATLGGRNGTNEGDLEDAGYWFTNTTKLEEKVGSVADTFDIVIGAVNNIVGKYKTISDSINKIVGKSGKTEVKAIGDITESIKTAVLGVVEMSQFLSGNGKLDNIELSKGGTDKNGNKIDSYFNGGNVFDSDIEDKIDSSTATLDTVVENVIKLVKNYETIDKSLKNIMGKSEDKAETVITTLQKNINNLITGIVGIVNAFIKTNKQLSQVDTDDIAKDFTSAVRPIFTASETVGDGYAKIRKSINKLTKEQVTKDTAILIEMFSGLVKLNNAVNSDNTFANTATNNYLILSNSIVTLAAALSSISANTIKQAKNLSQVTSITEGAKSKITSKNTKEFKTHTETIKKYVNSINLLNVKKTDAITRLVNSITKLSNKYGNIDELTNAIADKLTGSLDLLSQRLVEADKTIQKAEALHSKREQLIKNSIKEVQTAMNGELKINVTQSAAGDPSADVDQSPSTAQSNSSNGGGGGSMSSSSNYGGDVQIVQGGKGSSLSKQEVEDACSSAIRKNMPRK